MGARGVGGYSSQYLGAEEMGWEQHCWQSVCKITRLLEDSACLPTFRCDEEGKE